MRRKGVVNQQFASIRWWLATPNTRLHLPSFQTTLGKFNRRRISSDYIMKEPICYVYYSNVMCIMIVL